MTDSFLPFQHLIDPDRALRILRGATDGADDGELFLERTRSESLVFDDRRLRNAGYGAAQGFGLRAVRGEVTGYAHSTRIAEDALRDAADTARLAVGAGGGILAPAPAGPGPVPRWRCRSRWRPASPPCAILTHTPATSTRGSCR